ncbi:folate-binding protein YgfZ [Tistrella mobilis]|uniref:Uncharacterized protein n=1 Tax=Tistrella mobilis TaxID=171437 RepID=A0A162KI18_9PROT|nr:folate-binding protein YgfZ [Tistrella mobilis]KYO51333.1 hypothetical protein AUP44_09250 [Tistrella mobilis]
MTEPATTTATLPPRPTVPAFTRLPARSLVVVEGEDALKFLDGLVSGDLDPVAEGRACYGALLTPQGKILHDLIVARADDNRLLVECATGLAADLIRRLTLYKLRAKVKIAPAAGLAVAVAFGPGVQDAGPVVEGDGNDVLQVPDPRGTGLGLRLWGPEAALEAFAADTGLTPVPEAAWHLHRIEAGVPEGPEDLPPEQGLALEHDLDRLNGVAFDKGCYVGQEVTTRSKFRGQVRKRLFVVDATDGAPLPAPGTPVMAGEREAGQLRSAIGPVGLALLRIDRTTEATDGSGPALTARGLTITARPRTDG